MRIVETYPVGRRFNPQTNAGLQRKEQRGGRPRLRIARHRVKRRSLTVSPAEPAVLGLGSAVESLVNSLPPKERACVLLKDVFDYSLEEIAELVDTTVGGVKAALNRGRAKLGLITCSVAAGSRREP